MAELITLPFDTAKVRMMLYGMTGKYSSVTSSIKTIKSEQGTLDLWRGLHPAIMREIVFSGLKLAFYEPTKNYLCANEDEKIMTPMYKKVIAGVIGGGIACYAASPFDVVKIRMQDGNNISKYKNSIDCYKQIFLKEGGLRTFFTGVWPNVARNSFMNAAELTAFDTTRQLVMAKTNLPDHPALYLLYGTAAGVFGSLCAQPIDLVKTRVMNNPSKYKDVLTCIKLTLKEGGPLSFYNGIRPFMIRA